MHLGKYYSFTSAGRLVNRDNSAFSQHSKNKSKEGGGGGDETSLILESTVEYSIKYQWCQEIWILYMAWRVRLHRQVLKRKIQSAHYSVILSTLRTIKQWFIYSWCEQKYIFFSFQTVYNSLLFGPCIFPPRFFLFFSPVLFLVFNLLYWVYFRSILFKSSQECHCKSFTMQLLNHCRNSCFWYLWNVCNIIKGEPVNNWIIWDLSSSGSQICGQLKLSKKRENQGKIPKQLGRAGSGRGKFPSSPVFFQAPPT